MEVTKNQTSLMKHTMSDGGRNWFATDYKTDDSKEFEVLVEKKLATSTKAAEWMGDEVIYRLTESGKKYLNDLPVPKVKKLSKAKQRYQRYLEFDDCFDSFLDFCYWDQSVRKS